MTWSYSSASLGLSRNKVRLFTGDTDTTDQQIENEEIDYVLTVETSPTLAAASTCDLIAAKYARLCNTENGELRISAAARMKHYQDLADRLRAGGAGEVPGDPTIISATMYVGGADRSQKAALRADSENLPGPFAIGADDHPENPQPDSTVDPWAVDATD